MKMSQLVRLSLALPDTCIQDPPKEIRLLACGVNKSTKGDLIFDADAAASVMAQWSERGSKRLPFDYEHKMLDQKATPDEQKAAGWFTPEIREGELWATSIKWTPKAHQEIKDGERGYYSPAAYRNKETGRVMRLVNCALTSLPALNDVGMLIAASDHRVALGEMSFEDIRSLINKALSSSFPLKYMWIEELYDTHVIVEDSTSNKNFDIPYTITNGTCSFGEPVEVEEKYIPVTPAAPVGMSANNESEKDKVDMKSVVSLLALSATAGEAEVFSEVGKLKSTETELVRLTGKATRDEQIGTIAAWKSAAERLPIVQQELVALSQKATDHERDELIRLNERKLSPAMVTWAKTQNVDALKSFLAVAPDLVPLGAAPANEPIHNLVTLSDAEREVAKAGGMTDDEFKAHKAAIAKREGRAN